GNLQNLPVTYDLRFIGIPVLKKNYPGYAKDYQRQNKNHHYPSSDKSHNSFLSLFSKLIQELLNLLFVYFPYFSFSYLINPAAHREYAGPVGGYDHRPVRLLLNDPPENPSLRSHIQGTGSLIQDHHRRICQKSSGNGKPLFLAFRKPGAPLPDLGIHAAIQLLHKLPGAGSFQRLPDLLVCGFRLHHPHVLCDGSGEHGISLRDIAEQTSGRRRSPKDLTIRIPHLDPSLLGMIKTQDQI